MYGEDLRARSDTRFWEYLPEGEQEVYQQRFQVYGNIKAIDNDGCKFCSSFWFIPQLAESTIRFTIRNEELVPATLFLDELLIRQEVDELYRREGIMYGRITDGFL